MNQVPNSLRRRREREIIRRRRKRQPFSKIGPALGITAGHAVYLAKQIARERGQEVLLPQNGEELFNFSEAARHLGISVGAFHRLYRAGKVICSSFGGKGRRFVDKSELERLLDCPQVSGAYKCPYCQGETPVRPGPPPKTCGKALCRKKYGARKFAQALADKKKFIKRLKGWKKAAMTAIRRRNLPENEVWIKMTEAMRTSGISATRIYRLAVLGLISKRPINAKGHKEGSSKYSLYAKSEMELIRRFVKRYAKKQGR